MKEWDIDSYTRKWRSTHGFFRVGDGPLRAGAFMEFFSITKTIVGMMVVIGREDQERYALEAKSEDYPTAEIVYHPVESGWYAHKSGAALLTRRHVRGFQIGMSHNNFNLTGFDGNGKTTDALCRYYLVDFFNRPKFTPYDPDRQFGILNEHLWWKGDQLLFLRRTIGFFTGRNKLQVENPTFIPYIKPHVGESCQISS